MLLLFVIHIGAAGLPAIIKTTTIKYCYFQSAKLHDVTFWHHL